MLAITLTLQLTQSCIQYLGSIQPDQSAQQADAPDGLTPAGNLRRWADQKMNQYEKIRIKLNKIITVIGGEMIPSCDHEVDDFLEKLKSYWTSGELYNGLIAIFSKGEIKHFDDEECLHGLGFIKIGGACNGDPILIDKNFDVYYLDHDNQIQGRSVDCIIHFGTINEFLDQFLDIERIPGDAESVKNFKSSPLK